MIAIGWIWLAGVVAAAVTPEQRKQITEFESEISIAANLYTNNKFDEAAVKVGKAQKVLLKTVREQRSCLLKVVKPHYSKLEKAHALLELEGVELKRCQLGRS